MKVAAKEGEQTLTDRRVEHDSVARAHRHRNVVRERPHWELPFILLRVPSVCERGDQCLRRAIG